MSGLIESCEAFEDLGAAVAALGERLADGFDPEADDARVYELDPQTGRGVEVYSYDPEERDPERTELGAGPAAPGGVAGRPQNVEAARAALDEAWGAMDPETQSIAADFIRGLRRRREGRAGGPSEGRPEPGEPALRLGPGKHVIVYGDPHSGSEPWGEAALLRRAPGTREERGPRGSLEVWEVEFLSARHATSAHTTGAARARVLVCAADLVGADRD